MNLNSKFPPNQNGSHFLLQQLQQGLQQQQLQSSQQSQPQFSNDLFVNQPQLQLGLQQQPQQSQQQQPPQLQQDQQQQLNASNILAQTLYQGQYGRTTNNQQPQSQAQQHAQQQMQLFSQQLQQLQLQQTQPLSQQQLMLLLQLQQQQQQAQQVQQQQAQLQVQQIPQQQISQPQSNQLQSINLDTSTNTSPHWKIQVTLCQASRNANTIPHYWAKLAATSNKKVAPKVINGTAYVEQNSKQPTLIDITTSLITNNETQDASTPAATDNPLLLHKKLTNDSQDDEDEEQRIRIKTNDKQWWTGLDLSGQQIMYLSLDLFKYKFLNRLYLNGNKLQSIPLSIAKLKNLKYLDVSNNLLKQLPEELGLLFHLKYLYAFDNNLTTIPYSFGKLFELDFLGIEGNPSMDQEIINILAKKGTKGLTIHLRDNAPKPDPPKEREWIYLSDQGERLSEKEAIEDLRYVPRFENDPNGFTVMTYNTLCQHYATAKMYKYTPSWALDWDYRRDLLTKQVLEYKTDIVCLQEVETKLYEEYWTPLMEQRGYKGVFGCKTRAKTMSEKNAKKVDGCAIFFKTSKFDFIEYKTLEYSETVMRLEKYEKTPDLFNRFANKDNIAAIVMLKHKETGQKVAMVNTHLHWDPELNDVKAMQICVLLEELQFLLHKSNLKNWNVLIAGDFNSTRDSAVYELLSTGAIAKHSDFDGKNYGRFTSEGFQHQLNLKSAYADIGELPLTNLTPLFTESIDYIWYSNSSLQVKGLLDKVDPEYAGKSVGFPDVYFPSDHIPLVTKIEFRKSATQKLNKGAEFGRLGSRKT